MTEEDQQQPAAADNEQWLTRRELRERERARLAAQLDRSSTGPEAASTETTAVTPAPASTDAPQLGHAPPESVGTGSKPSRAPQQLRPELQQDMPWHGFASAPPRAATAMPPSEPAEYSNLLREEPEADPITTMFTMAESTRHPEKPRSVRRFRPGCVIALVVMLVLAGGGWFAWSTVGDRVLAVFGVHTDDYTGKGNGTEVDFSVLSGDTGSSIATRLAQANIIKTADAFVREALNRTPEPEFYPGTFRMQEKMSAAAALDALLDENARIANTVTIPEGMIARDVFALLESNVGIPAADLEAAAANPQSFGLPAEATSLEGFLFPATYEFDPGTSASSAIQTMVYRTHQALDSAGVPADQVWDIIRMASLVEKEARIKEDFYKVARVFYNRLSSGMPLQSDATVTYGTGEYNRAATTDAERNDASNPYNTYVHTGMIPGPISNPGDLAIDAAMHPAEGNWLYFVTVNLETGQTVFSDTYEEHEKAVDQWLEWSKEHPDYG